MGLELNLGCKAEPASTTRTRPHQRWAGTKKKIMVKLEEESRINETEERGVTHMAIVREENSG